jgi:hypothetical protein
MAAKMFAEVVIAGSYKNLAKSTRGAKKELTGFEKHAKNISRAIGIAFAGIAVAGLTMVTDAIMDMVKAASADTKSVALLNKQLDNSWKASDKTKKAMGAYLDTVSNMTGILDDDLRPAFAKIVRVTKGSTKATAAFNMALDISAGTGKDLNVVSAAYAKYLGGNKTALEKLVPGLKTAADATGFLNGQFAGMSEVAGKNDPFARINAVMDNFKEKLGTAFLPLINGFAEWLAGDDAQKMMDSVAKWVQDTIGWFTSPEGKAVISDWYEKIKELILKAVDLMNKLSDFANSPTMKFIAGDVGADKVDAQIKAQNPDHVPNWMKWFGMDKPAAIVPPTSTISPNGAPVTINVYAPSVDAQNVIKSLQANARSKGVSLQSLLR